MFHLILTYMLVLVVFTSHSYVDGRIEMDQHKPKIGVFAKYQKCAAHGGLTGIVNCVAMRALKTLQQASEEKTLKISPDIQLIAETGIPTRIGKQLDYLKISDEAEEPSKRASQLLNILTKSVVEFFSGRTLKVKLPSLSSDNVGRSLEEGRAKVKKIMGPLMEIGSHLMPVLAMLMGGVTMLSTKALIVGKLALAVSLILLLQYFFTRSPNGLPFYMNNGYGSNGYGVNLGGTYGSNIPNPQYPYARSFHVLPREEKEINVTEQQLAYSVH